MSKLLKAQTCSAEGAPLLYACLYSSKYLPVQIEVSVKVFYRGGSPPAPRDSS